MAACSKVSPCSTWPAGWLNTDLSAVGHFLNQQVTAVTLDYDSNRDMGLPTHSNT
jgi:hypothetical protein